MVILVTGGTGFIGEYFIPKLLEKGHRIRLLVRNTEKAKMLFADTCEYYVGDVTDKESLKGVCDGIDMVFHMVAKVGNQLPSDENLAAFRAVNVEGTRNIIQESKNANIKRFVFVSSIAAMGIVKETPITEKSVCSPYLPYQVTKFEAEEYIRFEINENNFPGIIVRPTKVYGVGEHEYSYLTLAKLCKKGVFPKVGKGDNYTSNIYVTDLVQALVKLVTNGVIGETYILSSDGAIRLIDSGKLIANIIGKRIVVISIPAWLMIHAAELGENILNAIHKKPIVTKKNIESTVANRIYDITKAKEEIDYQPEVVLEEGIKRTLEWYIEEKLI